ncbi:MAG TPA: transcriptional regulator [Thermoanaerobacterales bacterium]|nr:transcriptional regulator [Thermoanaerobacterales bacterium]
MWIKLLWIIGLMWMLQGVLTYFQIKNFQIKLKEMKDKGMLGIGTAKGRLGAGAFVIISVDATGKIIEAWKMTGISVFARFKPFSELNGLYYWEAAKAVDEYNKSLLKAVTRAVESVSKKNRGE